MTWKRWAIVCFLIALMVMPVWPYSQNWGWARPAFFWFLAALMIVMSLFRGAVRQEEDRELKQGQPHKND